MKRVISRLDFELLRLRDFRFLLAARLCFFMALEAQAVIAGWQIYTITKNPLMLGLIGLAQALPAIAGAMIAGHVVDASGPYRIYIAAVGALFLNAVALLLLAGGYVAVPGGDVVPWIFLCMVLLGAIGSFVSPANFSLFPQIVPRQDLGAGAAWMSNSFQTGAISGPAIAGLIYGGYGPHIAWLVPALLLAASFIMLASLSIEPRRYKGTRKKESAVKSIHEGWRFILKSPVILSIMALDMFAVFFGGAIAMLPAYADQVLHVGSEGLGLLRASAAMGAIVMTLVLAVMPFRRIQGRTLLFAVAGFGVAIIGFGLSSSIYLSIFFLILSGAFDSISIVIRNMILQLNAPEMMRGRISSINSMFLTSSNELGAFESGVAAHLLGLVPSVVFGGICTLAVVAATAFCVPQLRRMKIETKEPAAKEPAA